ncbi:MAG: hypothetical protein AAGI71_07415 [Bacteroidota bacterium]
MNRTAAVVVCWGLLLGAGCAATTAPLYQDYRYTASEAAEASSRREAVEAAFQANGWTLRTPPAENTVATMPRTVSRWGLYVVRVDVEAILMGQGRVRLLYHPTRHLVIGGRGKMPFLTRRLQRTVAEPLETALEAEGLVLEPRVF